MKYTAIIQDSSIGSFRGFFDPKQILSTNDTAEVIPLLEEVDVLVASGLWAVGFLSYEASLAFEDKASVKRDTSFPKAWYAVFDHSEIVELPKSNNNFYLGPWQSEISKKEYAKSLLTIKEHILRGDSYQTNFTFQQNAIFQGDALDCFLTFVSKQSTNYAAYIDCVDFSICSASPELFFVKEGQNIMAKPMKGTAPRSTQRERDFEISQELKFSSKERSENIMIVDLIRNDLSRIAKDQSVRPLSLYDVEAFETLWQMTSTIEARSEKSIPKILEALFPCASITGAPKVSTMSIIEQVEQSPRKIYTGSIGLLHPGKDKFAQFNVAIRTILIDHHSNSASYGIGSGILWDCDVDKEFEECLLKSRATPNYTDKLELLETMLWSRDSGIYLLDQHLVRLSDSARYFNFSCDLISIKQHLEHFITNLPSESQKLRLLLSSDGSIRVENFTFIKSEEALRLSIANSAINSNDIFLYHKTTERSVYKNAFEQNPGFDDVILWNERNEISETCIGNLAFRYGSEWFTPPISCGLLNGIYRQKMLEEGKIKEAVLLLDDVKSVEEFAVLNSVRGWVRGDLCL